MTTKLYKDGDQMGIWTDAKDEDAFLEEIAKAFDSLIGAGWCCAPIDGGLASDWEFQFQIWLPQVIELCCKYRGYKSEVIETRALYFGSIIPSDFLIETDGKHNAIRTKTSSS